MRHIHAAAQFHHLRIDACTPYAKYHQRANVGVYALRNLWRFRQFSAAPARGWREDRARTGRRRWRGLMGIRMLQQWRG